MAHAWNACWVHALGGSNPPSSALQKASDLQKYSPVRGLLPCPPPRVGGAVTDGARRRDRIGICAERRGRFCADILPGYRRSRGWGIDHVSNPGTGGNWQSPQGGQGGWDQGYGNQGGSGWDQGGHGGWDQGGHGGHTGYGAPQQPQFPQQGHPQQYQHPQQHQFPQQGSPQPGGPPPQGPRRPWGMIAVAFGCVAVLVLTVVVGIGIFALTRNDGADTVATPTEGTSEDPTDASTGSDPATEDPSPTETADPTPTEEAPQWEVHSPINKPPPDPERILSIFETGPLTQGSMFSRTDCTLPETPVDPTVEQLQASLDAAAGCLNQVWASTSSDRGLPWASPTIVVFTWPDIPSSACEHDTFDEGNPRMCNLDNTLYWPLETVGTSSLVDDPANMNSALVWDLSFIYMSAVWWNSGAGVYMQSLRDGLEGHDEDLAAAERRNSLQRECLATMVTVSLPAELHPTEAYRTYLTSEDSWSQDDDETNPSAAARAQWLAAGLDSGGDMASCNTWAAADDLVAAA